MAFTDILDPTKKRDQVKKFTPKVATPKKTTTTVTTAGTPVVTPPPASTPVVDEAGARYAAEQAFQAKQATDLTRQTADERKTLQEALVNQMPVKEIQPVSTQTSYADEIKQQSDAQTQALLAALKQRISESVNAQKSLIAKAPQTYDPLRAQSEVAKSQQLRSALERSSLMGDRGGIGRSEALATQTAGEGRLSDINLQQQNFIDDANAEVARLENEGRYQEAEIVASQRAQELRDLMNERMRQEGITREDTIRQENLALDERLREEERAAGVTAAEKADFINTLPGTRDFTQAILDNQNDGDPTNDWQIPYLELGKQDKLGNIAAGEEKAMQDARDQAMDKWDKGIPLNAQDAAILGVRVGATKPKASSGGSGGTSAATTISLAKWKVGQGLALNAQEAAALGLQEGYVDPDAKGGESDIGSPSISTINKAISSAVGDTLTLEPSEVKNKTLEWVLQNENLFLNDPELLRDTLLANDISVQELEAYEKWREGALGNTAFQ